MVPSFGAGLYYCSQRFFFGLSVPMLLNESEISDSGETTFYNQNRHYFLTSGILINFAENFQFKPSFLVKYVHNVPAQIDMNASFKLYDIVWFGLTYRTNNSYTVMFQYELDKTTLFGNRRLKIGYAFDIAQSEIRGEVGGTHEFFVSYSFRKNKTKVLNPKDFE